jgi:hypothetical protein
LAARPSAPKARGPVAFPGGQVAGFSGAKQTSRRARVEENIMPSHLEHAIPHDLLQEIICRLKVERRRGASFPRMAKMLATQYGILTDKHGVWQIMSIVPDNFVFAHRDPGKAPRRGRNPRRKFTWHQNTRSKEKSKWQPTAVSITVSDRPFSASLLPLDTGPPPRPRQRLRRPTS